MVSEGVVHDVIDAGLSRLDAGELAIGRRLARTYEQAFAQVEADLDAVLRTIGQAIAAGEDVNPDWLRREARYRQLLASIAEAYEAAGIPSRDLVAEAQRLGAEGGYRTGAGLLDATFGSDHPATVGFAGGNVPVEALERFVSATEPGTPLQRLLSTLGDRAAATVETVIANGIASGYSPSTITARIHDQLAGARSRAEVARLVRTETMTAFRGASLDQYARMGPSVVSQVRWTAALQPRTCLYCLSQHGKTFPLDQAPNTFHPNCRCVLSPVPAVQFASLQSFFQSGEDWFNNQPVATQRAMIGNDQALEAYRSGRLSLSDFAGERGDSVWGPSGYQRSGRAALVNAGIPLQL